MSVMLLVVMFLPCSCLLVQLLLLKQFSLLTSLEYNQKTIYSVAQVKHLSQEIWKYCESSALWLIKLEFNNFFLGFTKLNLHLIMGQAARKKALKGWDPTFIKRNFFPYWRSVLGAQLSVSNGAADEKSMLHRPQFRNSVVSNESSSLNHNISFLGRIQQLSGTHESRRYSTAAFRMLTKVLKTWAKRYVVSFVSVYSYWTCGNHCCDAYIINWAIYRNVKLLGYLNRISLV